MYMYLKNCNHDCQLCIVMTINFVDKGRVDHNECLIRDRVRVKKASQLVCTPYPLVEH